MTLKTWLDKEKINNPIVIFNKSHSGSRLLATLLQEAGIFIGSKLNDSNDALDLLDLVRYLVNNYYPDYSYLWLGDSHDETLESLIQESFTNHLILHKPNTPWGWKLCETTYILPLIDFLFPNAKYIHLIRDGRDVAFNNHRAPHDVFWKKVYFNTGNIETWGELRMTKKYYKSRSHIFNAIHWKNSVTVGRFYGSMLRERYLEVKYEDLCYHFAQEVQRIFDFLEINVNTSNLSKIKQTIRTTSIGKYKYQSVKKIEEIFSIEKPLLLSLGYIKDDKPSNDF